MGLLLLASRPVAAQARTDRKTALTFILGSDAIVGGPFNDAAETSGLFGTVTVVPHTFDDVNERPFRIGGEFSRSVTPWSDVFVRVAYTAASASSPVPLTQSRPLNAPALPAQTATFSDYRAWTIEGGVRRCFAGAAVRPFVGAAGGFAFVNAITVTDCCLFGGPDSRLFARSTAPLAQGLAGLDVMLGNGAASIGVESGFQYQFGLKPDLADLRVGPFVTDETFPGRRWSIPVTASIRLRF